MDSATILAAGAGAVVTLLLVAVVLFATRRHRTRVDLEAMLAAAQREADDLRHRLDEAPGPTARTAEEATWVITHVGEADAEPAPAPGPVPVPDRLVLSATLGEPLVKMAAFSHGVRRALAPETRNRIWFEMRREVRSARRRRLRLRKQLMREYRARERAAEDFHPADRLAEDRA